MNKWLLSETAGVFVAVLLGSVVMYRTFPESIKDGVWTHNVLRNWEEFGLLKLHGKLVYNPGGHDALENPKIYTGHRAASLYPSYLVGHLCGGAGKSGLPFYLLLTAVVAGATWLLLSKTPFALRVACAAAFSPGYIRITTLLDPMAIPVMLGLPVMLWTCERLESGNVNRRTGSALLVALVSYALLNWTVAFSFAIVAAYLLGAPKVPRKRLLLFCLIGGTASVLIVFVSVFDKMESDIGEGAASRWSQFYNAYLFGPGGYMGYPMNWSKAIVRLVAANSVALLPILVLFGWTVWHACAKERTFEWKALLPIAAAILSIAVMRNYFAHHQWMAASVLIVGVLFSLRLLLVTPDTGGAAREQMFSITAGLVAPAFVIMCVLYCYSVILFLRVNSTGEDSLRSLVQKNTRRHDTIVLSPKSDPVLAQNSFRLSELFDRKVVVSDQPDSLKPDRGNGGWFLLTASSPFAGRPELARTDHPDFFTRDLIQTILDWYRRVISQRAKGDRLETEPVYFLFPFPG